MEPKQGFEIKVVGRLVQQQQIRLLREQAREMCPHDPAAAHFARGPVGIFFAKAEARKDLLGLGFEAVAPQFVEAIVDVVVDILRVQRFHRMVGFPCFDDPAQLNVFRRDAGGEFNDRFISHRRIFLRQIAKGDIALEHDLARVR